MGEKQMVVETPEYWEFLIDGKEVSQLKFDYAFTLLFSEDSMEIRIEEDFLFETESKVQIISFDGDILDRSLLLSIFNQSPQSVKAFQTGELEIVFNNGNRIFVEPDPQYEAWTLNGPDGLLIVCLPGGGLAVWKKK